MALLGLALCAAAFLATRTANDTGGAVTTSPPVSVPQPIVKPPSSAATSAVHKAAPATPASKHHAAPATAAKPQAATKPQVVAKPTVSPEVAKVLPAIKALARGDVVVFFFTHPGSADDTGTASAVKSLAHETGVSVFTVGLGEIETYRPVLSGAGVSQVPAVVVVRAGQKARLIQGFVDSATLRQTVADARR
jgi:hypothetical protein